jgi:predicted ATP-binding protein involved in virulence
LIDEVENHLHVELQKNILPLLTNFFPNIQFIVTTHSPFVLQSIENSVVYDLEKKEQLSGKRLHIASYTDIVKNYFEVDSEFSKVLENKIVRYEKLVDQFENNTLDIEREKELLNLDIKLDEIAPMMSKSIFLRFKESQDRINDHGES